MAHVFIGVGSNIEPEENVRAALRRLCAPGAPHRRVASSTARRRGDVPSSRRLSMEWSTRRPIFRPLEFKFAVLRRIEEELGRRRGDDKYAARPIDLDLLVYDAVELARMTLRAAGPGNHRAGPSSPCRWPSSAPELVLPGTSRRHAGDRRAISTGEWQCSRSWRYTEQLRKDIATWIMPKLNDLATELLVEIGENPGAGRTGENARSASPKSLEFLTAGYHVDVESAAARRHFYPGNQ